MGSVTNMFILLFSSLSLLKSIGFYIKFDTVKSGWTIVYILMGYLL